MSWISEEIGGSLPPISISREKHGNEKGPPKNREAFRE
jgi:hypothetical protein